MKIILGTRSSRLALAQAYEVRNALQQLDPNTDVEIRTFDTRGDKHLNITLHSHTLSKGLFTEELEQSLADHSIDIAVHSLKDLPIDNAPNTCIAAYLPRADAHDAFLSQNGQSLHELPSDAIIGTSSPRRIAQLRLLYPHLDFKPVRGNVETRIAKMHQGQYAGLIMAAAGLKRLGLDQQIHTILPFEEVLPAPGQGVVAVQCRSDRSDIIATVERIDDPSARIATTAERALLKYIGGGCSVPLGALAEAIPNENDTISPKGRERYIIRAFLASADGERTAEAQAFFFENDQNEVIRHLAQLLLKDPTQ